MTEGIQINDQHFILHPDGVLFWKEASLLILSDVHLGKVSHFRKFGAAVPQNVIHQNFDIMNEVVSFFNPKCICFLGDLFHSSINNEWQLFEQWVSKMKAKIVLIEGNHDIISHLRYEKLGINVVSELQQSGFLLTHHPEIREGFYNFSGHIHPAIRLRGLGKQSLRLPCFFKSAKQMILPAFGKFTGTFILKPKKKDEVYAIAEGNIIKI